MIYFYSILAVMLFLAVVVYQVIHRYFILPLGPTTEEEAKEHKVCRTLLNKYLISRPL